MSESAKTKELVEIRGKDSRELRLDAQNLQKELFDLRFRSASEEIANGARFKSIRRTVAKIHTVLRERQMAEQQDAGQRRNKPSRRERTAARG